MMAVSIETEPSLKPGVPYTLFRGEYLNSAGPDHDYDRRNDRFPPN